MRAINCALFRAAVLLAALQCLPRSVGAQDLGRPGGGDARTTAGRELLLDSGPRGGFQLVFERVKPCGYVYLVAGEAPDALRSFYRTEGAVSGVFLHGQIDSLGAQMTTDADGNFLISEWNQDRVKVVSRAGLLIRTISGGGLDAPTGACLTPEGQIAIGSYLTDSIRFYSPTGTFLSNLSHSAGTADPQCLAYDRSGFLYVGCLNNGNGHVAVFNASRQFVQYIGQGLFNPWPLDIAFDANEDFYATTPGFIRKFSKTGTLLGTLSRAGLNPKGIAIDDAGNLWVTNNTTRDVYRFNSAGQFLDTLPIDLGPTPNVLLRLYGIAFDTLPDTDCNNNAVPDACDIDAGTSADCNHDARPDSCDLAGNDCDSNGILDSCQPNCDGDAVPDVCEIMFCPKGDNSCKDCNSNGIPDGCELNNGPINPPPGAVRSPINGHFYLLTPSAMTWPQAEAYAVANGGHLATIRSAAENQWAFQTFGIGGFDVTILLGLNDIASEGSFVWSSGEPVIYTNWAPGEPNSIGDEDWVELGLQAFPSLWNDANGARRGLVEIIPSNDCNQNNRLDSCDIAIGFSQDCNANGMPDECEFGGTVDCNHNGIKDLCEPGGTADCDHDGMTDWCELDIGAADCDANRVPDSCELAEAGLSFDGLNDRVTLPPNLIRGSTTLTLEAWFRTASSGVILGYDGPGGYVPAVYVGLDGRLRAQFWNGAAIPITTLGSVANNAWHHVALVGNVSSQALYLDGAQVGSLSGTINHLDMTNNQIGVGNTSGPWPSGNGGLLYFIGSIDEVRLWYVARTPAQIATFKDRGFDGPVPGLVGNWRFNEGAGQGVFDSSGTNHGVRGSASTAETSDPTWVTASAIPHNDCNNNDILDACDILGGAEDCNDNDVPDTCEFAGTVDCNNNGIKDLCDPGGTMDCNGNGIPDFCDISACPQADSSCKDCNQNGVPDGCELRNPSSLDFDGVDDFVRVPRSTSLEPRQALTIEASIRPDSAGSFHNRIARIAGDFAAGYILAGSQQGDGRLQLRIDGAALGGIAAKDTVPLSTYVGAWHHVAGVYSIADNYCRLYVDGILKDSQPAVGTINYSNSDLYIGNYIASSVEDFDGLIDEFRIWSVARTQPQIMDFKNRQLIGNEAGLVGYWRFDAGTGQAVADSSPSGNHAQRGGNSDPAGDALDPAWSAAAAPIPTNDCNANNIPDSCDIAGPLSTDCNANGFADECEFAGTVDCNSNGIKDICEPGGAADCNGNNTPDFCDISAGAPDCNLNGVPDECDILGNQPALDFDGVNDLVRVPRSASLEPTDELTLEAWIRADSAGPSNSRIIRNHSAPKGYILSWRNGGTASFLQLRIDRTTGTLVVQDTVPTSSYFGQWTHVAATYSVTANLASLYVNGVLKAQTPAAGALQYTPTDFAIGNALQGTEGVDGRIDEVRVWNLARSGPDIADFMNRRLIGNETGLVGYWRFDEGVGQAVADSSPLNNDGFRGNNSTPAGDTSDPAWITPGAPIREGDCNNNNIPDSCDIAGPLSTDCNANGRADECEVGGLEDCNNNLASDLCDIATGASGDCNASAIPDDCEPGGSQDCNGNGDPDLCDIFAGSSTDCDANAVPDDCQPDFDGDSWIDACDNCRYNPNIKQTDGDADGAGNPCDNCPTTANADQLDADHDGRGDACDNCPTMPNAATQADADLDGVGDACDRCPGYNDALNADGDCRPDACDPCPNRKTGDVNGDGAVDGRDIGPFTDVLLHGTISFAKLCAANVNSDKEVNEADIPGFLNLLMAAACP